MIISIDSNTEKYKINGTEASILTIDGGVGTDASILMRQRGWWKDVILLIYNFLQHMAYKKHFE